MTPAESIKKHGYTSKAVRAWCAWHKVKYTKMGAPSAWYEAWKAQ